jgi:hypothetical protein
LRLGCCGLRLSGFRLGIGRSLGRRGLHGVLRSLERSSAPLAAASSSPAARDRRRSHLYRRNRRSLRRRGHAESPNRVCRWRAKRDEQSEDRAVEGTFSHFRTPRTIIGTRGMLLNAS